MSAGPTSRLLTDESDWDLVVAAKNGEDLAFEILIKRYKARILSLALRITRNREDAQDVVQESFQKAFVHLQEFQGKSTFSTWLHRITINEALMCLRKNRVSRTVSIDEVNRENDSVPSREICDASANQEETYIRLEKERILCLVIDGLPPILKRVVRLYLDDLTVEEMRQCLGVRTPTVKARLFRGRHRVRALFKRYLESPRNRVNHNLETVA